jgi:hypothetical protein
MLLENVVDLTVRLARSPAATHRAGGWLYQSEIVQAGIVESDAA